MIEAVFAALWSTSLFVNYYVRHGAARPFRDDFIWAVAWAVLALAAFVVALVEHLRELRGCCRHPPIRRLHED